MDEKPKSIWKKSIAGRMALVIWLAVATLAVILGSYIAALADFKYPVSNWFENAGIVAGIGFGACLVFIYVVWPLLRWLFWKHWRRTLFGCACFATLIALFYAEEDWRGRHDWEKFKREWEAKGEHFDYASVIPAPVPDDQNFALTPVIASSYERFFDKSGHAVYPRNTNVVDRLTMITWSDSQWAHLPGSGGWQESKKTDLKAWQDFFRSSPPRGSKETNSFPVAPQPQSPAADVLLALSKYDSAIEEIRQASALPDSRFPLIYGNGDPAAILLPHLSALKSAAQTLDLRALAELQTGQSEMALADVKLSLRLADAIRTEPSLISHLVRIAIMNLTLQPVWEGLADHQWSDAQMVELDQVLAKFDFLTDYGVAMRGERACGIGIIDFLQRQRSLRAMAELSSMSGGESGDPLNSIEGFLYSFGPIGWLDQNKLRICRFETQWNLPLVDAENKAVSPKAAWRAGDAYGKEMIRHLSPYNYLERMLLANLSGSIKKFAYAQSSVDLARVAIALERYRLAHGEYPDSLDALAPQFMEIIPRDIIGGQPLHYWRTNDGQFVLYSVGWNETDDGGVVVFNKYGAVVQNEGDWVWRYPAK